MEGNSFVSSYKTGRSRPEESTHSYMCHPLQKAQCPGCRHTSHTAPVAIGVEVLGAWGLSASPIVLHAGAEGDSFSASQLPVEEGEGSPCQWLSTLHETHFWIIGRFLGFCLLPFLDSWEHSGLERKEILFLRWGLPKLQVN